MTSKEQTLADVQHYYGEVLQSSSDLKTSACCPTEAMPAAYRPLAAKIHPEILDKFYGCGSPLPFALEGRTVLDLGCGTGRDTYMLANLVGPNGHVHGVDMTAEQLDVARKHLNYQMEAFGFETANVTFHHGHIEDLASLGIEDNSVDVVVSNCVINLSPEKEKVFSEIFRVLKPGGELYFADVFADSRIPKRLAQDPVLLGECLGGAMYVEDFRRMLASFGCLDYRTVSSSVLDIHSAEVEAKIGMIGFTSQTVRAFKVKLEDRSENYGHVARYLGTIPQSPHGFMLDDQHIFRKGLPVPVSGNTAAMLADSRYADHFQVDGSRCAHYGLFNNAPVTATAPVTVAASAAQPTGSSCC